jgi:hypothetical protein
MMAGRSFVRRRLLCLALRLSKRCVSCGRASIVCRLCYSLGSRGPTLSQNLWTAFIAANGSDQILVASTKDGNSWTASRFINQTSPFTPSIAFFNRRLYLAFITNDVAVSGGTSIPSNRIFICSTADGVTWSAARYFGQHSKCSPSLAAWNGSLYLAFISNDSSNRILVCSFAPDGTTLPDGPPGGTWTGANDTGQASPQAPSLATYNGDLYLAFTSNDSMNKLLVSSIRPGGSWPAAATDAHQSCSFSPSLAEFNGTLYVAFAANNGSRELLLCSLGSNGEWSPNVNVNQSSAAGPGITSFNNLCVSFIANNPSAECLLTSSSNPSQASSWPATNTDLMQQSDAGAALAVAPFICCSTMEQPSSSFGGGHNYFIWSGITPPTNPIGLTLTIEISSDLISSNGLSFQWNGWSPAKSPAGAPVNCIWQQYGFTIDANGNISGFAENWPSAAYKAETNQSNICDHRPFLYRLPTPTLSAGYSLVIQLANDGQGNITGVSWTVYNQGNQVGNAAQQTLEYPPTNVPAAALAPLEGFACVLVGFDIEVNKGVGLFVSGQGTFTVTSDTALVPDNQHAPGLASETTVTGETGNSAYAQLPLCPSKTIVQPFWVTSGS